MIPLKLQLRNFLSYGEDVPPLLFDGFQLACLCGDNGQGKSALLDAITWALWGRARGKSDDDLIRFGKQDMAVEFEFQLGAERYRVIRMRNRRAGPRRAGVSGLELQVATDSAYRALSGDSIAATQRRITDLLKMDYETFVNSAFLLQGRADSFALKTSAERKKVLADILGLGIYDELESRARERVREAEGNARLLTREIEAIDRDLAERPNYERELETVLRDLHELDGRIRDEEAIRDDLRRRRAELGAKAQQADELEKALAQSQKEMKAIAVQIEQRRRNIAQLEGLLARREELDRQYAQLQELKVVDAALWRKQEQWLPLREEQQGLEQAIGQAKATLEHERERVRRSVMELEAKAARAAEAEGRLAAARMELAVLDGARAQLEEKRTTLAETRNQQQALEANRRHLEEQRTAVHQRLGLLQGQEARCPLCGSELGSGGIQRLQEHMHQEEGNIQQRIGEIAQQARQLAGRERDLQHELKALEAEIERSAGVEGRLALAERELEEIHLAQEVLEGQRAELSGLEKRMAAEDYAQEQRTRLSTLREELERIGYNAQRHNQVRRDLEALAAVEERRTQVLRAEDQLASEREGQGRDEQSLARWREAADREQRQHASLQKELAELPRVESLLRATEERLAQLQTKRSEAQRRLGEVQQKLARCQQLEVERVEKQKQATEARLERGVYEELTVAFGRNGIQAMIIDSALPEIEEEANLLLGRLTDHRMRLALKTQRPARSGDRAIETLDIVIQDELGTRSYELYSGGEAFRVNFALRIALSRLLARRAGAQLQTLVIDEGFGTQDSHGIDRLVEAIMAVKDDFAKILVVTHIDELKDRFPVRIEVTKSPQGSWWELS
ncbi:MAG: SMC family ATPase [Chloroflexi bacterium]|nr:SMC family ATPase [Chloroflexota bacterium]